MIPLPNHQQPFCIGIVRLSWDSALAASVAVGLTAPEIMEDNKPHDVVIPPRDRDRIPLHLRTVERLDLIMPYDRIKQADVVVC